jgi:hypothetical protein
MLAALGFLIFIGPWPTYAESNFADSNYFARALADIEARADESAFDLAPPLQAGWARRDITPEPGVPMAGYGQRFNMTPANLLLGRHEGDTVSTGVHDTLHVKALAFSDGSDTVVFVGADMLLTPPNVAEAVRANVASQTPLTANNLYFGANHTHCGPGGWAPGIASRITGGEHHPEVVDMLINQYTEVIVKAYKGLEPARFVHRGVDAPDFIRNRTREAPTDSELSYLHVQQEDGDACFLVSYSAHPTVYGSDMTEFSAEYPGAIQNTLGEATGAEVVYLGGAVGSMGPRAPEAPTTHDRVQAMGAGLAQRIIDDLASIDRRSYTATADVLSAGTPLGMPGMQVRPVSAKWRMSPLIRHLATVPAQSWLQGARVGNAFFVGLPFDFSGEISVVWKDWAKSRNYDLWTTSFNSAYSGYLSPDAYYMEEPLDYETGLMSWFGPEMEAYFTALFEHMFEQLTTPEEAA